MINKEKELILKKIDNKKQYDEDLIRKDDEYSKLNEKYKELYEKMKYYKNFEMNLEHDKAICHREFDRLNSEKNHIMLELYDKISKNKNLKYENEKLNQEIKELESIMGLLDKGV
jgi:hypothetical protein